MHCALILMNPPGGVKGDMERALDKFVNRHGYISKSARHGLARDWQEALGYRTRRRRAGKAGTDRGPKGPREFRKGLPARASLVGQRRSPEQRKAMSSETRQVSLGPYMFWGG
jgi:hypothetical protein